MGVQLIEEYEAAIVSLAGASDGTLFAAIYDALVSASKPQFLVMIYVTIGAMTPVGTDAKRRLTRVGQAFRGGQILGLDEVVAPRLFEFSDTTGDLTEFRYIAIPEIASRRERGRCRRGVRRADVPATIGPH